MQRLINLIKTAIDKNEYSPEAVAAEYFNIPKDKVTPTQRMHVKEIAFSFLYGSKP